MAEKVVVTGIGIISPIGYSKDEFFKNLLEGNSYNKITSIPNLNGDEDVAIVSEAQDFKPEDFLPKNLIKRTDRSTQMALAAVCEALADADLDLNDINRESLGIYTGISVGGLCFATDQVNKVLAGGLKKVSAFLAVAEFPSSCLGEVSIFYGIKGRGNSVSTASNSSLDAIGLAFNEIKRGNLDYAIAGGTEAPLIGLVYHSLSKMGFLSTNFARPNRASKPFDKKRDGFVLSEGACFLVLESHSKAIAAKKKIYAELVDYESSFDPSYRYSDKSIRPIACNSLSQLIRKNAFLPVYISAFAPSEKFTDKVEIELLEQTFKNEELEQLKEISGRKEKIALGAIKSIIGHSLGASGAFQVASACLSIKNNVIPPTINIDTPEPELAYFNVSNKQSKMAVKSALVNGLDFFGNNSFILLQDCA